QMELLLVKLRQVKNDRSSECKVVAKHYTTDHSLSFLHDRATAEFYTLSLHDALPISSRPGWDWAATNRIPTCSSPMAAFRTGYEDRKSTRLNSSHVKISYAVFCLKKKS